MPTTVDMLESLLIINGQLLEGIQEILGQGMAERLFTGLNWFTTSGCLLSLTIPNHKISWKMVCFFCSFVSLSSIILLHL
jgi:hypothetical protein